MTLPVEIGAPHAVVLYGHHQRRPGVVVLLHHARLVDEREMLRRRPTSGGVRSEHSALDGVVGENVDAASVPAPAARDRVHGLLDDLGLLDCQFTTDGVVVEGSHGRGFHDVEASDIAARGAPVSSCHAVTVLGIAQRRVRDLGAVVPSEEVSPPFVVFIVADETELARLLQLAGLVQDGVTRLHNLASLKINHASQSVGSTTAFKGQRTVRGVEDDDPATGQTFERRLFGVYGDDVAQQHTGLVSTGDPTRGQHAFTGDSDLVTTRTPQARTEHGRGRHDDHRGHESSPVARGDPEMHRRHDAGDRHERRDDGPRETPRPRGDADDDRFTRTKLARSFHLYTINTQREHVNLYTA